MESLTLTRKQAAAHCNISLPTLDAYIRRANHPLPHIRLSSCGKRGKILIPAKGLERWIEEEAARNEGR